MQNVHYLKDIDRIEDEAALWVLRLEDRDCTEETLREFRVWLEADSRHKREVARYTDLWQEFDDLKVIKSKLKIDIVREGIAFANAKAVRWYRPHFSYVYGAIAASLLAFLVLTVVISGETGWSDTSGTYSTAVGQSDTVALSDGSTIQLNSNSIVKVNYSADRRDIHLVKGEAYFSVAHDRDRPFVVRAQGLEVEAVGTEFSVFVSKNMTPQVIVTDGRVRVSESADPGAGKSEPSNELKSGTAITLVKGQILEPRSESGPLTGVTTATSVPEAVLQNRLSWRRGILIFQGETLEEVVASLGRYSDTTFIIEDDSIRSKKVGGHFKINDLEALLESIELGLDVEVVRKSDDVVVLKQKDPVSEQRLP